MQDRTNSIGIEADVLRATLVNLRRNLRDVALVRNPPPRAPFPDGRVLDGAQELFTKLLGNKYNQLT